MNDEPPLILISKQLLIVYEVTSSCSRKGTRERRGKSKERSSKKKACGREQHRCNIPA